jgi:hypothetical protein
VSDPQNRSPGPASAFAPIAGQLAIMRNDLGVDRGNQ